MTIIVVELPGEPKGKGRPRFVRRTGRAYTPAETANYESMLRHAGAVAMDGALPLTGPLIVSITAHFTIPQSWSEKKKQQANNGDLRPTKKPDVDNVAKMMDGLNGIVFADDAQVVTCTISKWYSYNPRLQIEVGELK